MELGWGGQGEGGLLSPGLGRQGQGGDAGLLALGNVRTHLTLRDPEGAAVRTHLTLRDPEGAAVRWDALLTQFQLPGG